MNSNAGNNPPSTSTVISNDARRPAEKQAKPIVESVAMSNRIKSALVTEQDVSAFMRAARGSTAPQQNRFRPVTSHSGKSLIASLYKQQGEQRSRLASRGAEGTRKLPVVFQAVPLTQAQLAAINAKRKRGIRAFALAQNASKLSILSRKDGGRSDAKTSAAAASSNLTASCLKTTAIATPFPASPTWSKVRTSMSAGDPVGSLEFGRDCDGPKRHNFVPASQRASVNYVPFYEIRGRGDGASVVDAPSIDVEGKNIAEIHKLAHNRTKLLARAYGLNADASRQRFSSPSTHDHEHALPIVKSTPSENNAAGSVLSHSAEFDSQNHKHAVGGESCRGSSKTEKKVRFSSAVTTNQIDAAVHKATSRQHHDDCQSKKEDAETRPGQESSFKSGQSATEASVDEEEYATPVLKVVVTKRQTPAGAETLDAFPASLFAAVDSPGEARHAMRGMTSRVGASRQAFALSEQAVHSQKAVDAQSRRSGGNAGSLRQQNALAARPQSTHSRPAAQHSDAISRFAKLVPKRQTVVMPNFPRHHAATPKRDFPVHANNPKLRHVMAIGSAPPPGAAAHDAMAAAPKTMSRFATAASAAATADNLRSRLVSAENVNRKLTANNAVTSSAAVPGGTALNGQHETGKTFVAATPFASMMAGGNTRVLPMTEAVAPSTAAFTDFQPIPSIPDHINFCDAKKTELIMRWLEDVNKKRNIESKLKRVVSSHAKVA